MEAVMSHDYRYLLGRISMDLPFAESFFAAKDKILGNYTLSQEESTKLMSLSSARFDSYRKSIVIGFCDCDSCCNGGEGKGNCSECFACCCQ